MQFAILGSLEVTGEAGPVPIRGPRRRALVAYLLVHHGHPRALERIIDDIWEGEPSDGAAATVQTYVSQLRKLLAPATIARVPGGYVLELPEPETLDAVRFARLAEELDEASDPSVGEQLGAAALGLFRDVPLLEFAGAEWADRAAASLESQRLAVVEHYVDALLAVGRHADAVALLEEVVADNPLDERFWAQLVLGLWNWGRHPEALRACARVRQILAAELGIEPGPELRRLEQRVLEQDETLSGGRGTLQRNLAAPSEATPAAVATNGVWTFLLTDVVGSTALWDMQPAAMAAALPRLEHLVRTVVESHSGRLVKARGEGDSSFSVFDRATDAVTAATSLLDAIGRESWPTDPRIHVRMAVHTGEAEHRDDDYFGSALNRAARLRAVAGADEVVCSRATADLVVDALPRDLEIVERGVEQLAGLHRPEVVHLIGWRRPHDAQNGHGRDDGAPCSFTILDRITARGAAIASPQLRALLARLVVDRNRAVPNDDLVGAVWGENAPASAKNSLQSKISRLRTIVGDERVVRDDSGYRLVVRPGELDVDDFEDLAARAGDAPPDEALAAATAALAKFEGRPYGDLADASFVRADVTRLEALRRSVEDRHLELVTAVGRDDEALAEAEALLGRDPFRESAWAVRLRLLGRLGRRVEALRAFHIYRTDLAEQTGLLPSAALLELERTLLEGESVPTAPAPAPPVTRLRAGAGARQRSRGRPWLGPVSTGDELAGREPELEAFDDAIVAAASGTGRFVVMAGEAGIGKTRFVDEIARRATARGFTVLRASGLAPRAGALGAMRNIVAELVPEMPAAPDVSPDPYAGTADAERAERAWAERSLAFVDALVAHARETPVLLAIDDMHALDDVSLTTLDFIHGAIADARPGQLKLLVLVTHRSIGAPEHVLARADRFSRAPHAVALPLGGLDELEVKQLVTDATTLPPTPALVDALGEASGNPLITLALLQAYADARALVVEHGSLDIVESTTGTVPYDLREIVAALVARLDPQTRTALVRIALLGDNLPLDTVASATGWSDDELANVLETAEDAGVLRVEVDRVHFTHDLLRWSIAHSVAGVTRRRMHRELAAALARETDPDDPRRVTLLAEQLRLSGDASPEARLGYWSEIAGDHCIAQALWGDAIRNYDAAAQASDTADKRRPELLAKSGIACFHHHDPTRAAARLVPAIAQLEEAGQTGEVGAAAIVLHRLAFTLTDDRELAEHARDALTRFVDTAVEPHLAGLRARAFAQLAEATFGTRQQADGERFVEAAQAAVIDVEDDEVHARVWFGTGLTELTALHLSPALDGFAMCIERASRSGDPWIEAWGLGRAALATTLSGDLADAERALEQAREAQYALRFWSELSLTESVAATVTMLRGDAAGALATARRAVRFFERSGYRFTPALAYPALAVAHLALGNAVDARATIDRWRTAAPGGQTLYEAAVLASGGDPSAAGEILRTRPLRVPERGSIDLHSLPSVTVVARIALALNQTELLRALLPVIDDLCDHGVLVTMAWPAFLPALAAEVAAATDEPDRDRRAAYAQRAEARLNVH
jgi:DNA-binding SARP family transcriptional activator